jgi:hypothetical protein
MGRDGSLVSPRPAAPGPLGAGPPDVVEDAPGAAVPPKLAGAASRGAASDGVPIGLPLVDCAAPPAVNPPVLEVAEPVPRLVLAPEVALVPAPPSLALPLLADPLEPLRPSPLDAELEPWPPPLPPLAEPPELPLDPEVAPVP